MGQSFSLRSGSLVTGDGSVQFVSGTHTVSGFFFAASLAVLGATFRVGSGLPVLCQFITLDGGVLELEHGASLTVWGAFTWRAGNLSSSAGSVVAEGHVSITSIGAKGLAGDMMLSTNGVVTCDGGDLLMGNTTRWFAHNVVPLMGQLTARAPMLVVLE